MSKPELKTANTDSGKVADNGVKPESFPTTFEWDAEKDLITIQMAPVHIFDILNIQSCTKETFVPKRGDNKGQPTTRKKSADSKGRMDLRRLHPTQFNAMIAKWGESTIRTAAGLGLTGKSFAELDGQTFLWDAKDYWDNANKETKAEELKKAREKNSELQSQVAELQAQMAELLRSKAA